MARGISVHVGINELPYVPGGVLHSCENDARSMARLAAAQGYATQLLLGPDADFGTVYHAAYSAALALAGGDIFMLTFSGHGVTRSTYRRRQEDGWCLHDRVVWSSELRGSWWTLFPDGVRILVVSDSCSSGTVVE